MISIKFTNLIKIMWFIRAIFIIQVVFLQGLGIQIKEGYATYYLLDGYTSCGPDYSDSDFVAAIDSSYWTAVNSNNDPLCQMTARVSDPSSNSNSSSSSSSIVVKIVDKCGACQPNDIDLSPAAFQVFRNLSVGRFPIAWNFTAVADLNCTVNYC